MNLRHLRYFVAVAEELHFGRAAARLHMAQPPLSQQIRRLEEEIGVELLRRTTRTVELTDAGRAYLERARAILADVDDAARHARLVAAGTIGRLVIGCVGSATYSVLPLLSQRLSAAMPQVDFVFRGEMLVPDQVAALRSGTIDVGLLRPFGAEPGIAVAPLRRDGLVVALPREHPLAGRGRLRVRDLAGADLIVHSSDRGSVMATVVAGLLRDADPRPRIRHRVEETSTAITLVAGGLGVAIVPEPTTALALDGVVYVPLAEPGAAVDLSVAHRAGRTEPHLVRALDTIASVIGR